MARESRRARPSLSEDLRERPQAYDLFQAVRLAERIAALSWEAHGLGRPDPVGRGVDPRRAAVRITTSVDPGFAAAEVLAVRPGVGVPTVLVQTVVGLVGPGGPMPPAFTELVQAAARDRNPGFRAFLDVFSDRLAALLYDAHAKHRPAFEAERRPLTGRAPIDDALRSAVGLASPALANRLGAPDADAIRHAGLLGRRSRSAHAIERTLSGALGEAVRVEPFVGEWLPVAPGERTRLAGAPPHDGAFARLGRDAVAGARSWSVEGRVRLVVGPLPYRRFASFLPGGEAGERLAALAGFALGPELAFVRRLVLRADEVPDARVGGPPDAPGASRLGWNTWLAAAAPRRTDGAVDLPARGAL